MIRKTAQRLLCILLFSTGLTKAATLQAQGYTENFDDISLLPGNGWVLTNNSSPVGILGYFQGNNIAAGGPFDSYNGAANSYIGVNFNSTSGGSGVISNWLITPNRTIRNGDVFTFYTRKPATPMGGQDYPDRLEVRLSTNGASTNVGAPGNQVGDFTTLLLSINPTLVAGGYPYNWTQYTITISGLPAPTSGRIAFRYFVTGAGPSGTNSDYIGIDNVVYTPYICPTVSITNTSLPGGSAGTAYSQSLSQTGCLGAPNYAITAGALPPGLTLSAAGTISGTPTATGTFNFTATVNDASGCAGSRALSITTVCPSNPITFNAPSLVCSAGSPVMLTATPAGGTFSGTGVSAGMFDPAAGNQTVTYDYVDPYGCSFSSSTLVTVTPSSGEITATPTTQTICSGEAIEDIIPSVPESGTTFTWTRDNTATITGMPASGTGTISGSLINSSNTPVTVTFTISAASAGCSGAPITVTVIVGAAPVITTSGSGVMLANSGTLCTAVASYDNILNITGAPAPTVTYEFTGATTGSGNGTGSGSTFNVGITNVKITASNSCGTTDKTITVTILDIDKPVITGSPAAVTVSAASDVPAADITTVTATDNCSGAVVITHEGDVINNQACDDRYTITRTYKATDAAGNSQTVSQVITVNDETAPVFTTIDNVTVTSPVGSCTAVVNFNLAATDNSGRAVNIATLPASGSVFQLGTTTVTATATDVCGNETVQTFTVTVLDGQLPVVTALPAVAVCAEKSATFSVTANNVVAYQWQVLVDGDWENLTGETSETLTVENVTVEDNGTKLRVKLEGTCSVVYSDEITLTVYNLPEPVITTASSICLDERSIQLAATPAGGTFEGRGVTGTTWNLEEPSVGQHRIHYTYTDPNGCMAKTSKVIDLDVCAGNKIVLSLQAYPNPTVGRINLKALVTKGTNWSVSVTNLAGKLVTYKRVAMREGWNNFEVDLNGQPAGIYIVSLVQDGKRVAEVKVMKN